MEENEGERKLDKLGGGVRAHRQVRVRWGRREWEAKTGREHSSLTRKSCSEGNPPAAC